jgi:hypothetical protein
VLPGCLGRLLTPLVELDDDPVGIDEHHRLDVAVTVVAVASWRLPPGRSVGSEPGDALVPGPIDVCVDVIDEEPNVVDADLVQRRRLARRWAIDGLAEHDERGARLVEPAQVDTAAMEAVTYVDLLEVAGDREPEEVAVEGQRTFDVAHLDRDVRHTGDGRHGSSSGSGGQHGSRTSLGLTSWMQAATLDR